MKRITVSYDCSLSCLIFRSEEFEMELRNDLKMRVALSATSLPSICFYTFFNTYDRYLLVESFILCFTSFHL
jgi:hypothetical protein